MSLTTISSKKRETVRELSKVCSQLVLECLFLARIGRPDIPWSVNTLARAVTKWTRAFDKRLARLISYTSQHEWWQAVLPRGNTAQYGIFWDCFRVLILLEILKTQNRLREEFYVSSGVERSFPRSWMCKEQTSVSHSSTESGVKSLDSGLRMDGVPALDLWDLVMEVITFFFNSTWSTVQLVSRYTIWKRSNERTKKRSNTSEDLGWTNVDYVTSNVKLSRFGALVSYFRRLWSGDQDDQQRQKPDDETRVPNSQSCAR